MEESIIYKEENRTSDLLTSFPDYLPISKTPINHFDEDDVFVGVNLKGIDKKFETAEIAFIDQPIPISRISTIVFKSHAIRATFLSSVKTFPDTFVPGQLCIVAPSDTKSVNIDLSTISLPPNDMLQAWRLKLDLFDKYLGMFAFIKNTGVIYAEAINNFQEYTSSFLNSLFQINQVRELEGYKENALLKSIILANDLEPINVQRIIFKSLIDQIKKNEIIDINTAIEIIEKSIATDYIKTEEKNETIAIAELFKQYQKMSLSYKDLLQKDVIRKNYPVLALLFISKFSNKSRQHTDKQAVRNFFIENAGGLPVNDAEYILALLGFYYGYKNMIKEDTNLRFADPFFQQLADGVQSIKFKLSSTLDRFIIESIFSYTTGTISNTLEIQNLPKNGEKRMQELNGSKQSNYNYKDRSFHVFNYKVVNVERLSMADLVIQQIENNYPDKIDKNSYLTAFILKHFKLDKSNVVEQLKKNLERYSVEELQKVIELDLNNRIK